MYALVDWDNLERTFSGRNMAEHVALELQTRLVALCSARYPSITDIEVRCYSGWLNPNGSLTPMGRVVRPMIEALSARIDGLLVRMFCPDEMIIENAPPIFAHLVGPRDCRCGSKGQIFEQKIVDTMIVADAAALAEYTDLAIVVVGDDIDLAPGLVMASSQRSYLTKRSNVANEVVWLRRRPQTRQTRLLVGVADIEEW